MSYQYLFCATCGQGLIFGGWRGRAESGYTASAGTFLVRIYQESTEPIALFVGRVEPVGRGLCQEFKGAVRHDVGRYDFDLPRLRPGVYVHQW